MHAPAHEVDINPIESKQKNKEIFFKKNNEG